MARVDTHKFANGIFAIEANVQYDVVAAEYQLHADFKDQSSRHIMKGEKGILHLIFFNMFGHFARVWVLEREYFVDVPTSSLIVETSKRDNNVRSLKPKPLSEEEERITRLMGTGVHTRKIDESVKRLESQGWTVHLFNSDIPDFTAYVDYGKQEIRSNIPKANLMAYLIQRVEIMANPDLKIIEAYTYQYVDAECVIVEGQPTYQKILSCEPYTGDLPRPLDQDQATSLPIEE